jgi:hypothetical protein
LEPQPSIFPFGIRIDEPVIAATDLLVAAVCFLAYFKMSKSDRHGRVFLLFRYYFLFLGLATCWGSLITHAFIYAFSNPWKVPGWVTGMFAVALIAFASIEYSREVIRKTWTTVLSLFIVVELLAVIVLTVATVNFQWTGFHSFFGLAIIAAPMFAINYWKLKDKGSLTILVGIGIFSISAIVFTSKLSISKWFNHVDLTHVILAIAVWTIYKGAAQLKDRAIITK